MGISPTDPLRICVDRDCPDCGWPELIAVGTATAGPERMECPKCPFNVSAQTWNTMSPEGAR